ncbi:helix-turn-helix domain-containing protein [Curtobacterium sp. VKM Ac-2922]|uniref:helix-turn-helix domain-containing protein n=1 Tax=Curtobacterium sp. VKM Ac-2922 TaxID=2929475 RepID=UPI001FB54176|nr:helix-turn-helix domain-containing protein [Curtobacterium sp. VKM Ac-2922]MCJ1715923.1 helix-turn-helix domain-containing protein [Curtobacterium sp. VKM Ac-2922]
MAHGHQARGTARTTAEVVDGVGPRLRGLRQRRDVTLAALATETGISVSTLSRLESGQRRPTLELLLPLARAYQVPLDDLVGAPQTGDPRVHLQPESHGGRVVIPLTRRTGGVRSFKQLFPPHSPAGEPTRQTHEGYEWLYVLSGRLRLLLGERDLDLGPGEVVEFDTHTPHWIGNVTDQVTEVLCLYGPQGERAHVRSRPEA